MRSVAFGYSTRCNIKCEHCVAGGTSKPVKMELSRAKELIAALHDAKVQGISFTAGEPLIYLNDIAELIGVCADYGMYTRVVTNSFWGKTAEGAAEIVGILKGSGLSQLRLSYSRYHQAHVPRENVVQVAHCCLKQGLDYFVSFVSDFSEADDEYETYLRTHQLKFFPEPMIFSGRAEEFVRTPLRTDYQANCCPMNPYLAPTEDFYGCCDAGSHFTNTNFFHLGNVQQTPLKDLFDQGETKPLYHHIRNMGITTLASFAGFKARDIIGYRKCELCAKLFNSKEVLARLEKAADAGLNKWYR